MNAQERLSREIEGLTTLITTAREILADGRAVDLAGLDNRIGRVCEDVRALPEQDAASFQPRLVSLLDEVDRLANDLETHRAKVARALGALSIGKNAVSAYHKGANKK